MDTLTYTRAGDSWLFSDGTTLPVIAGGDGTEGGDAGADAPADAPAADVVADPSADAGATPVDPTPADPSPPAEVDPFDDEAADSFPRAYVAKLREEAAARRTEAKAFSDAFEGYDDADRETLLDLARTLRTDPATAAEWMRSQAEALLAGDDPADPDGADADDEIDPDAPLTAAQLEKYLSDREAKAERATQERAALEGIASEAKALGFDPEANDGADYVSLLHLANKNGGDLAKAAEQLKARNQKIVDDFLAQKAKESDTSPTSPPQAGGGRETPTQPSDWDDIGRAVRADISARR